MLAHSSGEQRDAEIAKRRNQCSCGDKPPNSKENLTAWANFFMRDEVVKRSHACECRQHHRIEVPLQRRWDWWNSAVWNEIGWHREILLFGRSTLLISLLWPS